MAEVKRTAHQCPICKEIIYNVLAEFQQHLNTVCTQTLFSKYPGLKNEKFNALWYKLDGMVKEKLITPSGKKGVSAQVLSSYPGYTTDTTPTNNNNRNKKSTFPDVDIANHHFYHGGYSRIGIQRYDLEDVDRQIEQRERDRAIERKRRRHELEKEAKAELENDEFVLSMPKLFEDNPNKKRRLLYHNTSDIRPPKRVNIDPTISMKLFQHKIRESRRKYHNVSYQDFLQNQNKNRNDFVSNLNVDQHPAVIHTQRALDRYLLNCEMLRKCTNGKLFNKITDKFEKVYGSNYEKIIMATLNEINLWQNFENENLNENEQKKDDKEEFKKENFLSSWDAIPQQTMQYQLERLLQKEDLCGFYAKLDQTNNDQNGNNTEKKGQKHSFWNASNNVKHIGYNESMFHNRATKKYVKL